MKQLNIFELQSSIDKKRSYRTNVFDQVLEKCHKKIVVAAQKEYYECVYDVPHYVPGLPLFNVNACINHLIDQLKLNGFEVTYYFPKTLLVSWRPKEVPSIEHNPRGSHRKGAGGGSVRAHSTPPSVIEGSLREVFPTKASSSSDTMLLNYIPYKNDKGKFVLNVD